MKDRSEFPTLSLEELSAEIACREAILPNLVGNLWPQVLLDEITELKSLTTNLE